MLFAWVNLATNTPRPCQSRPLPPTTRYDTLLINNKMVLPYYARKIGIRHKPFAADDRIARAALRTAILDIHGRPAGGGPLVNGGWPAAYAARQSAWHALDHMWEIQDKS